MGWAETETDRASLPDARLKRRLTRVLEQLSAQPTASIPAASGTWADRRCCINRDRPHIQGYKQAKVEVSDTELAGVQRSVGGMWIVDDVV